MFAFVGCPFRSWPVYVSLWQCNCLGSLLRWCAFVFVFLSCARFSINNQPQTTTLNFVVYRPLMMALPLFHSSFALSSIVFISVSGPISIMFAMKMSMNNVGQSLVLVNIGFGWPPVGRSSLKNTYNSLWIYSIWISIVDGRCLLSENAIKIDQDLDLSWMELIDDHSIFMFMDVHSPILTFLFCFVSYSKKIHRHHSHSKT